MYGVYLAFVSSAKTECIYFSFHFFFKLREIESAGREMRAPVGSGGDVVVRRQRQHTRGRESCDSFFRIEGWIVCDVIVPAVYILTGVKVRNRKTTTHLNGRSGNQVPFRAPEVPFPFTSVSLSLSPSIYTNLIIILYNITYI